MTYDNGQVYPGGRRYEKEERQRDADALKSLTTDDVPVGVTVGKE